MPIDALPVAPDPYDKATFNARAFAFVAALVLFRTQANALASDVNDKQSAAATSATNAGTAATTSTTQAGLSATARAAAEYAASIAQAAASNASAVGTSTTSIAIGTGSKAFTIVETGRAWAPGMVMLAFNAAGKYMMGRLSSYAANVATIEVTDAVGSGTYAAWNFSVRPQYPLGLPVPVTSSRTLNPFALYEVDVSAGALDLTLPAAPVAGDWIEVVDVSGAAIISRIRLLRNGSLINGAAADYDMTDAFVRVRLAYNATKGWVVSVMLAGDVVGTAPTVAYTGLAATKQLVASDMGCITLSSTSAQTIKMPDATTLGLRRRAATVKNAGSYPLTIQDYNAGALTTLVAGDTLTIWTTSIATSSGSWTTDANRPLNSTQQAALDDAASGVPITTTQTGTTYTLTAADAGKMVPRSNASANSTTVPPNSTTPIAVGKIIFVQRAGTGLSSIVAGSGVTINRDGGLNISAQYKAVALLKTATDTWLLFGGSA